jgi:hypothetical protein
LILIPAGFHLLRFHPSTHIAPKLSKLTVPSPSPNFTPFCTWNQHISLRPSYQRLRTMNLGSTLLIRVLGIYPIAS